MTIPADVLKLLDAEIGSVLELDVVGGTLIASPKRPEPKRRYSLAELMEGVTPDSMQSLHDDTEWFREAESMGRELP